MYLTYLYILPLVYDTDVLIGIWNLFKPINSGYADCQEGKEVLEIVIVITSKIS